MFKTLTRLLCLALFALTLPLAAEAKTFYWISHGSPADPVWTYFLAGREHVGQGHRPDRQNLVPQRRRRLAAGGDPRRHRRQGRRHRHHQPRSRQPGEGRRGGARGGNSGHQLQHARPESELQRLCRRRSARWSARTGRSTSSITSLVKSGDFVWMPVEVPGASYGVEEEKAIADRVQAAQHHLGSDRRHARPGERHLPHERLPHRQPQEDQGDHRPRRPRHRLDQARVRPGRRQARRHPGRRLGQFARHHRRSAARAMSTPASGRIRRRPATWRSRSPTWRRAASRRASTSPPARSTARTPRRSTTRSCRASNRLDLRCPSLPSPPQAYRRKPRPGRGSAEAQGSPGGSLARYSAQCRESLVRSLEGELACGRNPSSAALIAAPEFGPFVLLVVELAVFYAINPDFLSVLNI